MEEQAARLILIQSVTSAVPGYTMHMYKLPIKMIECLEKTNRDFLQGDDEERSSIHSVSWEKVCQPKEHGGLELRPIKSVNQVLLAKLV